VACIGNIYKLEKFLDNKKLAVVFEYFKEAINPNSNTHKRIFSLPIGAFEKYYITDDIFAIEQVFYTKEREECFIESHKNYIDFQLILSGKEQMEYIDIDKLEIEEEYDEEKDLIIYKFVDHTSKFLLEADDLAIFYPDDAHIGLPQYKTSELVYKTVIKFPVKMYNV